MKSSKLSKQIEERSLAEANYIFENECTIRDTAPLYGVSKSTVFNDMNRLKQFSMLKYKCVRIILEANLEDRARRGGASTGKLYAGIRAAKEDLKSGQINSDLEREAL